MRIESDPVTALVQQLHEAAGNVAYLRARVGELAQEPEDGVESMLEPDHAGDLQPHVLVKLYNEERDRLAKYAKLALDAGVAERQIKIAERQGEILANVVLGVVDDGDLALTPDQKDHVKRLTSRHLRLVTGQDPDGREEFFGPDDVLERCRPLIEQHERCQEAALIERLAEEVGQNDRAVSGLSAVLEALHMRRVEVLLINPAFHADGVVCGQCGRMAPQGKTCPFDETRLDHVDDIVEQAVEAAVLQSAAVHEVQYHETDRALGGPIAALLRF